MVVERVSSKLSWRKPSVDHARSCICGMPAWRCFTAGRPSKKLARADPLPSFVPVLRSEAVLEEAIGRPRAKLHLRNAGLALLHGGQTEQETGEGGSAAVVCAGSRRVAARELVVAAILEEAPHRPDIVAKTAAEVQTVTAALPTEGIAALDGGVPSAHRRGGVGIAHAGITLHVKPRRPPGTRPAKAYAQNTQLRNDVVGVGALRKVAH